MREGGSEKKSLPPLPHTFKWNSPYKENLKLPFMYKIYLTFKKLCLKVFSTIKEHNLLKIYFLPKRAASHDLLVSPYT